MKIQHILAVVSALTMAFTGAKSHHNKHSCSHKGSHKLFAKMQSRMGRIGLVWIRGHPIWSSIANSTFNVLAIVDQIMIEYPSIKAFNRKHVAKFRRSFGLMQAATMNLPYATEAMRNTYNSFKPIIIEDMLNCLHTMGEGSLDCLAKKKNLRSQKHHTMLSNALQKLNITDYQGTKGTIMQESHVKPDKRQFTILDITHPTLCSSEAHAFEISAQNKIWHLLPTHYNTIVSEIFTASNNSARDEDTARDLCSIAFYLQLLNVFARHYKGIDSKELSILITTFPEFQASMARLVSKLLPENSKSKWLTIIDCGHKFNMEDAFIAFGHCGS